MLYAHIEQSEHKPQRRQSLALHSTGAAAISAEAARPLGLYHTAYLAGLVHDLGKAKGVFQAYLLEPDGAKQKAQRGTINHSTAGARYLWERVGAQGAEPILQFCAQLVSLCVASHHSGFPDCVSPLGEEGFLPRLYPTKDLNYQESLEGFLGECVSSTEIEQHIAPAIAETSALVAQIQGACRGLSGPSSAFFAGLAARYLFSCVLDGDRYDTYCFAANKSAVPSTETGELWGTLCARLEAHLAARPRRYPVDALRAEISDTCQDAAMRLPGIYQLYVPTGAGKTLSSLRFALHHAKVQNMAHIFYVTPFTTIIDQTAQVFREVLREEDAILEHHSNLLPENDETERGRRRLLTERWSSPIVLTTMVQFLNTLFAGGTQNARRMHSLSHAVIVFDEIQAIPVKCIHLFNLAILFLSRVCKATILLCTATQPQLGVVPIPLCYDPSANLVPDYTDYFAKFRRTDVVDVRRNGAFNTAQLADFICRQQSETMLVILNTKKAALRLFETLCQRLEGTPGTELCFLSTELCPAHRLRILGGIRQRLAEGGRTYIVSTQLIEAGVDLSVDCVVRSLAGLDNIAQAAGRCNRHGGSRRQPVYIIQNSDERLGQLEDIRIAQERCIRVLDEYAAEPAAFDHDLLSPKAIVLYYITGKMPPTRAARIEIAEAPALQHLCGDATYPGGKVWDWSDRCHPLGSRIHEHAAAVDGH